MLMEEKEQSDYNKINWLKQAEKALICCCVLSPADVLTFCVSRNVGIQWFHNADLQLFWLAMTDCLERGIDLDEVTLCKALATRAPGRDLHSSFMNEVMNAVETHAHWRAFFNIIECAMNQRCAIREAERLLEALKVPAKDLSELREMIQGPITVLSEISLSEDGQSLVQVATELCDSTRKQIAGESDAIDTSRLIYTGIKGVDDRFRPLNPDRRDNSIIIAGRTSEGKSALARQICSVTLQREKIVVDFCLETSRADSLRQMASQEARVDLILADESWDKVRQESGGEKNVQSYMDWLEWFRDACEKTYFCFEDDFALNAIEARIREVISKTGRIDLIIIDYCQLVQVEESPPLPREQQIAKISRTCKRIAKQNNCVLLLLAQLNRDVSADGPTLRNLRESGSLEQDADRVWFTCRPEKDKAGNKQEHRKVYHHKLIQAKMRNGPKGYNWTAFNAPFTRFDDLSHFVEGDAEPGRPRKDEKRADGKNF